MPADRFFAVCLFGCRNDTFIFVAAFYRTACESILFSSDFMRTFVASRTMNDMAGSNFVDYVKIFARSGHGGGGSTHFRREKFVAFGGPGRR